LTEKVTERSFEPKVIYLKGSFDQKAGHFNTDATPLILHLNFVILKRFSLQALTLLVIVAFHKGGNKLDPGYYRLIAVLSNLSKIFERVLHNRIVNFLDGTDFYVFNQFGFFPHSSMTSVALAAVSGIRMSL
jgi:hypothetical protein